MPIHVEFHASRRAEVWTASDPLKAAAAQQRTLPLPYRLHPAMPWPRRMPLPRPLPEAKSRGGKCSGADRLLLARSARRFERTALPAQRVAPPTPV